MLCIVIFYTPHSYRYTDKSTLKINNNDNMYYKIFLEKEGGHSISFFVCNYFYYSI